MSFKAFLLLIINSKDVPSMIKAILRCLIYSLFLLISINKLTQLLKLL